MIDYETYVPTPFDFETNLAAKSEKRSRGRPKKVLPALPPGHHRHALSDSEADSIEFPALEKTRFINEFKYELQVLHRSVVEILKDLCPLYNIPYQTGHSLVSTIT